MNNFWKGLKEKKGDKPILVLAPMADVTDAPFRRVIAKYGKPDVLWTEFVSADGLILAPEEGRKKLLKSFEFSPEEKPIIAQIFGSKSENIEKAAALVQKLGFDGIDLNMGCPDRSIEKQKAGAAMIKYPDLAMGVILAAQKGAPNLPLSIKIRLGYNKDELEEWLPFLLETNPAVITIHARIRKDMSKVPADWSRIKRAVEIRDELGSETLIFGNGDVATLEDADRRTEETGCDGVMIGRGIFGNPWFFSGKVPSTEEKLKVMVEHTKLFKELLPNKSFSTMKKHYKAYVDGFEGAKELRLCLMDTQSAEEVENTVQTFLTQ